MYHYYKVIENSITYGVCTNSPITDEHFTEIGSEEYLSLAEKQEYHYKILDANGNIEGVAAGGGRITDANHVEVLPTEYDKICAEFNMDVD